jgi:uncharacterized protein YdeI (YjbR/CyaY-like superfamily)
LCFTADRGNKCAACRNGKPGLEDVMKIGETLDVQDRRSWRTWLAKNHKKKTEIWLIYYRKDSGKPRIPYNDAVEEALCYGWIDSTVKAVDEERFAQRFSVRKKTSSLSPMNKERVRKLIDAKKMTRAGLAAIAHVFDPVTDRPGPLQVPPDILRALKRNKEAWQNFKRLPEAYKRIRIAYIESRKRHGAAEYRRSLNHFVDRTAKNKRIGLVKEMP